MTTDPLVSIIIPVYNAEKYLRATIESALAQSWPNKEIIVIDDGSTDSSLAIAEIYSSKISVVSQPNSGASAARNKGLELAKGSLIQFLDADDLLSIDKIQIQVEALGNSETKVAVCSTVQFQENGRPEDSSIAEYDEQFLFSTERPTEFLIKLWGGYDQKGGMVQPNAWLSPRSVIDKAGPWNEGLSLDDDGEFFARVILQTKGIIKTGGLNYYRKFNTRHSLSGSTSYDAIKSLLQSALSKKNQLLDKSQSKEAKLAIFRLLCDVASMAYPNYMDIVREAEKNYPDKFPYYPHMGGKMFMILSKILGWKTAKRIKLLLRK